MKYNIVKNWIESFELLTKKKVLLVPFLILGFFEALALEFIYFSPGVPFMYIVNPFVKKFFGPQFVHYPANLVALPKLFYYAQVFVFIFIGVVLYALTIELVKRLSQDKPIKKKQIAEKLLKRYGAFVLYGIIVIAVSIMVKRFGTAGFYKVIAVVVKYIPEETLKLVPFGLSVWIFISRIVVGALLVLVLPFMVIKKLPLVKAFTRGVSQGALNIIKIFIMVSIPYLLYLPILLLKTLPGELARATFPDIIFYIALISIFASKLIECFITVCITRFVLDRESASVSEGKAS